MLQLIIKLNRQEQIIIWTETDGVFEQYPPRNRKVYFNEWETRNEITVGNFIFVKVELSDRQTMWIATICLTGRNLSISELYRVIVGVHRSHSSEILAHVFIGIEGQNCFEMPSGDIDWKGFSSQNDLEADTGEELTKKYLNVRQKGIVRDAINKAESPNARFKTIKVDKKTRNNLVKWIETHSQDDYIYGSYGCIGFIATRLQEVGINLNDYDLVKDGFVRSTALEYYKYRDEKLFKQSSLEWLRLEKPEKKMFMEVSFDSVQEIMLLRSETDKGVIRREKITRIMIQKINLSRDDLYNSLEISLGIVGNLPEGCISSGFVENSGGIAEYLLYKIFHGLPIVSSYDQQDCKGLVNLSR